MFPHVTDNRWHRMTVSGWYGYLFYRICEWRLGRPKTAISQPEIDAALLIAVANLLYVVGVGFLFCAFSKWFSHVVFYDFSVTRGIAYVVAIVVILLHLYGYVWSGNSKRIMREYEKQKDNARRGRTFGVIFYMIFSYVFALLCGLLLAPDINARLPHF